MEQAAEVLNISRDHVYALIRTGAPHHQDRETAPDLPPVDRGLHPAAGKHDGIYPLGGPPLEEKHRGTASLRITRAVPPIWAIVQCLSPLRRVVQIGLFGVVLGIIRGIGHRQLMMSTESLLTSFS